MKDYFRLLKNAKGIWFVIINFILAIGINFSDILTEKAFSLVVSDMGKTEYLVWFIGIEILYVILMRIWRKVKQKNQQKMTRRIQQSMYQRAVELPLKEQSELEFGKLTNSIVESDKTMSNCFEVPEFLIETIVGFTLSVILLFMKNRFLLLMMMGFIVPVGILMVRLDSILETAEKSRREQMKRIFQLIDRLNGFLTIKSFGRERKETEDFREASDKQSEAKLCRAFAIHNLWFVIRASHAIVRTMVLVYEVWKYRRGQGDLSELVLFDSLFTTMFLPFRSLPDVAQKMSELNAQAEEINEILSYTKEEDGVIELNEFNDSIELRHVGFEYDTSKSILKDVSLKIKKGSRVGIYGKSGSGKSTLVNLLMRFYKVTKGKILIDGININDITKESLRKRIGIINQDVFLFSDTTIRENICYGCTGVTETQMIEAAKLANCHEFITKLPDGYESKVGNNGVKLSGGERQRITLARVFLRNPDIIIFDEATSKLDNESEELIKDSLSKIGKDKTVISIAHRFTTIEDSDLLVGIQNHKIVECGTKEELLKKDSLFKKLYK